nr:type I secretion C-terminal target domain-containing protein [Vibrio mexicanus]
MVDYNREEDRIDLSELVTDSGQTMEQLLGTIDVKVDGDDITLELESGHTKQVIVIEDAVGQFNGQGSNQPSYIDGNTVTNESALLNDLISVKFHD